MILGSTFHHKCNNIWIGLISIVVPMDLIFIETWLLRGSTINCRFITDYFVTCKVVSLHWDSISPIVIGEMILINIYFATCRVVSSLGLYFSNCDSWNDLDKNNHCFIVWPNAVANEPNYWVIPCILHMKNE